jgi:hypothetical protein
VIVSEEPTAMFKGDPCSCGSLYFRDWHLLSSRFVWPRARRLAPHLQTFIGTAVYRLDPRRRSERLAVSFLPDVLLRWRQRAMLTELREINMATWRQLTRDEHGAATIDPDTLERLRGLGYVN